MRPRLTILGMMALIGLAGVGLVGLRSATALWASAVFSLTAAALTAATIGAALGRRTCLGFAIAGWAYILAVFGLWPEPNGVTAPPFLTKSLMDYFQPPVYPGSFLFPEGKREVFHDPGPAGEAAFEAPPMVVSGDPPVKAPFRGRTINLLHYRRIGHSLAAILCGLLGSLAATAFSTRGRDAGGGS
jgi:hypothetical protein